MGFLMGAGVGLTTGFIFGTYSILRWVVSPVHHLPSSLTSVYRGGAGPRGALATLSQYMLASGGMFAFFLSIGSVIRNDSDVKSAVTFPAASFHHSSMIIRSRADGYRAMQARWDQEKTKNM
ncbi:hypothetical protein FISHEDRAFT_49201 [Fistulina hepatica ATCC 64428]|uniref:Uncharacterized protein n=1 Tax=Fistulina hepatica ATCC 64428 TaxID=1128425 RepID=A0A0D7A455_9AGAR|nr:hypothetical protein FISHEDRAFT_49201 [Fistulina hepatica ATCC 64428]